MKPISILTICLVLSPLTAKASLIEILQSQYETMHAIESSGETPTWECKSKDRIYYASIIEVPFRLEAIQQVLANKNNYPRWQPEVREIENLEKTSDNSWLYFSVNNMPWPFKDRQSIVRMTFRPIENDTWTLEYELGDYPGYQMRSNCEPLTELHAYWMVRPTSAETCEICYALHINHGGRIPEAIDKPFKQKLPLRNLHALNDVLKTPIQNTQVVTRSQENQLASYR